VVEPSSVLFVPAGEEHRFVDVEEDLTVLVISGRPRPALTRVDPVARHTAGRAPGSGGPALVVARGHPAG
jgi:hypothetical protein